MAEPFDVCWERIARADTHRDAIATAWNAFIEEESHATSSYVNPDGTGAILVRQLLPLPSVIALELGEFLYQLRAALDAAIYEIACVNSEIRPPADERSLEFPICTEPETFKDSKRRIAPLTDQQRSIVEGIQPYAVVPGLTPYELTFSYNRCIGILNDWARKDRHRKLHIVVSQGANVRPMIIIPDGTTLEDFVVTREIFMLTDESEIATFRIHGWKAGMKMNTNPNLTFDVAVDEIPAPCHERDTLAQRMICMKFAAFAVIFKLAETVNIRPDEKYWVHAPPH
jgi:hypothetical protein